MPRRGDMPVNTTDNTSIDAHEWRERDNLDTGTAGQTTPPEAGREGGQTGDATETIKVTEGHETDSLRKAREMQHKRTSVNQASVLHWD